MKRILKMIKHKISFFIGVSGQRKVNIGKTIYYNLKLFPFNIGIKLPIYIYSGVQIGRIGKIYMEGKISGGMIKIGKYDAKAGRKTKIFNYGSITFNGQSIINAGVMIENYGKIVFEENYLNEDITICIFKKLVVGKGTRIGFQSVIMDSNSHYTVNIATGETKNIHEEVILGKYNWLGYRTAIKKGVKTPDYLIVGFNSTLTKDYTSLPAYSTIIGSPAKLITSGYRRIFNFEKENELNIFFKENDANSTMVDVTDIDEICKLKKLI